MDSDIMAPWHVNFLSVRYRRKPLLGGASDERAIGADIWYLSTLSYRVLVGDAESWYWLR
jgi:hypothetical protein